MKSLDQFKPILKQWFSPIYISDIFVQHGDFKLDAAFVEEKNDKRVYRHDVA